MSDDTPTQRFEPPPAQPQPSPPDDERKSRLPLVLGIVGGVLLIAVIVLLVLLLGRSTSASDAGSTTSPTPTSTPSPTPTHTESASPTPTPTPTQSHTTAPPAAGPAIQTFLVDNSTSPVVLCNTNSPNPTEIDLTFQWASTNVSRVYFGVDTNDASQGPLFSNLPPSGTQADFPSGYNPYPYPCPAASEKYTLTVVGAGGAKVSRSITVLNKGDQ